MKVIRGYLKPNLENGNNVSTSCLCRVLSYQNLFFKAFFFFKAQHCRACLLFQHLGGRGSQVTKFRPSWSTQPVLGQPRLYSETLTPTNCLNYIYLLSVCPHLCCSLYVEVRKQLGESTLLPLHLVGIERRSPGLAAGTFTSGSISLTLSLFLKPRSPVSQADPELTKQLKTTLKKVAFCLVGFYYYPLGSGFTVTALFEFIYF